MMLDLATAKNILKQSIPHLRESYSVRRLGVFGSVARGDTTQTSDVDILVELRQPIGLFKLIELEDRLKILLKRDVDIVTVNALKPFIKDVVLRETVYV